MHYHIPLLSSIYFLLVQHVYQFAYIPDSQMVGCQTRKWLGSWMSREGEQLHRDLRDFSV